MGHRALVAYRRPDDRYDLRYSHWGGEDPSLAGRIDAHTPLADGAVDASPLAESISFDGVLTRYLDPCTYELLYVVAPDAAYAADVYRVCWLEWADRPGTDRGVVVETTPERDRALEAWTRATKTTLADVVDMGRLSENAARNYLESRLCTDERGVAYTYLGRPSGASAARAATSSREEREESR
ncbi:DUF6735 family protein [Halopiger goleimassiliensis]|uniref:DUF6735 family protein n=1 Tax=Halopiger goleimassiliensis TaxID=1293048 RepID=UPI000677B71F|nr:DUF6735 family protein [Halopiger goleimassiliensis]